jgi:hypothetical protein
MNTLNAFLVLLISWGVAFKVFFNLEKEPILVVDHKKII